MLGFLVEGHLLYYHYCRFKKLCEEAFLKLRESGPLFLNLFTMMMSCGIPELQTRDDISYIRYQTIGNSKHDITASLF